MGESCSNLNNQQTSHYPICKTLFDSYPDIACAFSAVAFRTGTESIEGKRSPMTFKLRSPEFANGADMPRSLTCDGEDRSPSLEWGEPPSGTESLALIADDPDAPAGTWVHWVIFNIPASVRMLPAGFEGKEQLPDGTRQGTNDFRKIGYNGPCPPPGKPHRYFFKLYALNTGLALPSGARKRELEQAMAAHILESAEWMGRYRR